MHWFTHKKRCKILAAKFKKAEEERKIMEEQERKQKEKDEEDAKKQEMEEKEKEVKGQCESILQIVLEPKSHAESFQIS